MSTQLQKSNHIVEIFGTQFVIGDESCSDDPLGVEMDVEEDDDHHRYNQLWYTSAGPLVTALRVGERVCYFPQGHLEQVEDYTRDDIGMELPVYKLDPCILCKVASVHLKAEANTDEVFLEVELHPNPMEEEQPSATLTNENDRCYEKVSFSKILSPSDTSIHGCCSVPKSAALKCFPPLDMSREHPSQDIKAWDLHGKEWVFRHAYRGSPQRHLLTFGWSAFVNEKKIVRGDILTFIRRKNGEFYVGIRRATRPKTNVSASAISGYNMQHGILATACEAVASGIPFTVYYRPWMNAAEFMIPYDQYLNSARNDYSVGTRFKMKFETEDDNDQSWTRFTGIVTGIDVIDPIRWPGSEWRCLEVQWDVLATSHVRPTRISPWNAEPELIKKRKSSDPSSSQLHELADDGVLQGQEARVLGTHDRSTQSLNSQKQPLLIMPDSFFYVPGKLTPPPPLEKSPSTESLDMAAPKESEKVILFGIDLSRSMELPSVQVVATEPKNGSPAPQTASKSRVSDTCQSLRVSGSLPNEPCKTSSFFGRTCTKVHMDGVSLGRSVDLNRFDDYNELIIELDRLFEFNGTLEDGSCGWCVSYIDNEGDTMKLGDYPWPEFRAMVRRLFICPEKDGDGSSHGALAESG